MMRNCTITHPDGRTCDGDHKAHGLCLRHYAQSRRRWTTAGQPDIWDWPDHVTPPDQDPNFTGTPQTSGESLHQGSPPVDSPGVTAGDSGSLAVTTAGSNRQAVEAVVGLVPARLRGDYRVVLALTLAQALDDQAASFDSFPSAATARELRNVMKEVVGMAEVKEVSALGQIRDDLAARRAARGAATTA